jgi:hypothetical protein
MDNFTFFILVTDFHSGFLNMVLSDAKAVCMSADLFLSYLKILDAFGM